MLQKKFFIKSRKKLFQKLANNSLAIIHAKDPYMKGDSSYFSQFDPNLFYFSGITQEQTMLIISNTNNTLQTYLFITKPDKKREIWEGKKITKQEAKKISGIKDIFYFDEFEKIMQKIFTQHSKIYLPENLHEVGKSSSTLYYDSLKETYQDHTFLTLEPYLKELRQIKEKEEITQIKSALKITNEGFRKILHSISKYNNEAQVEAELTKTFISNFAVHAYHPIVAQDNNALTLHYISNNTPLKKNKLLLIDAGAQINGYHSDITRTYPLSGKFTQEQKDVYTAVLTIQKYAISLLKPGIHRREYEIKVLLKTAKELIQLNLLPKKKIQHLIDNFSSKPESEKGHYLKEIITLVKKYYPHSTSHFLGLDTHDSGDYSTTIQEGEVLTVEPGIYIKKKNIGIRIEDNVIITNKGCEILSKEIPKTIEEIEKIANTPSN